MKPLRPLNRESFNTRPSTEFDEDAEIKDLQEMLYEAICEDESDTTNVHQAVTQQDEIIEQSSTDFTMRIL